MSAGSYSPGQLGPAFSRYLGRDLAAAAVARAPGRLNLLGEHTDYNDGFVLPIAIDRATYVAVAPAADRVRVWSEALAQEDVFDPNDIVRDERRLWANYVRGVFWALRQVGVTLGGADVLLAGDLPLGAGLSSSASLETACARACLALAGREMPPRDLALLCQRAENDFVGVRCGIMDQFAVGLAREGHALLLDCLTLDTRAVPLAGDSPVFFVCDTTRPRTLAASAYNQRRAECEGAARHFGCGSLRDVTADLVERDRLVLGDTVYRRCRHVLGENRRVLRAMEVMADGDWAAFGDLLKASHASLRDDYEVSCVELDTMCELAQARPGCLGARMVGAGFGGCAMAAVERCALAGFAEAVAKQYREAAGCEPRIFAVNAAAGAALIRSAD